MADGQVVPLPVAFATRTVCAGCAALGELLGGAWVNVGSRMHREECPEAQKGAHPRALRRPHA